MWSSSATPTPQEAAALLDRAAAVRGQAPLRPAPRARTPARAGTHKLAQRRCNLPHLRHDVALSACYLAVLARAEPPPHLAGRCCKGHTMRTAFHRLADRHPRRRHPARQGPQAGAMDRATSLQAGQWSSSAASEGGSSGSGGLLAATARTGSAAGLSALGLSGLDRIGTASNAAGT